MQIMNYQEQYKKDGYLYKFKAFDDLRAKKLVEEFNINFKNHLRPNFLIKQELLYKIHLVYKSFNDVVREEKILEIVREILGKNIVCWNSLLFYKKKSKFVTFHQDLKYWKFLNEDCLTVSLALTKSTIDNGCLIAIPGSHISEENHLKKYSPNNLLANYQSINVEGRKKKFFELDPGEFSIHHGNIVHGSYENKTNDDRILLAIRYAKDDNLSKIYHSATYINKKPGLFEREPLCKKNFDNDSIKFREKLLRIQYEVYFKKKYKLLSKIGLYHLASNKIIRLVYNYFFKK
jgi:non-heme Fe2+,alpha-ketoglutarate-dependent halogenase